MKVLKIAAMATVAFALGACDGSESGTSAGPISAEAARASFVALPDSDAAAAAQALVGGDVDAAIAATRDILQRGRVRVLTDTQLLGFAFDGRRRAHQYRLDSAQLAHILKSLGFPFSDRS